VSEIKNAYFVNFDVKGGRQVTKSVLDSDSQAGRIQDQENWGPRILGESGACAALMSGT